MARKYNANDSRNEIGDPYQIYTEVVNAGKTLQGEDFIIVIIIIIII